MTSVGSVRRAAVGLTWAAAAALLSPALARAATPFVGCASDGQLGPQPAPARPVRAPVILSSVSGRLAYYASRDLGVLAPRGWRCFGLYGSDGAVLVVTPEAHGSGDLLQGAATLTGPAVVIDLAYGDTSGRFAVAKAAARLFPSKQGFVRQVIGEGVEPAGDFPMGPYPTDLLKRRGPTDVEFETPAGLDGMGTQGRLARGDQPILGVAIMTANDNLVIVDARLPPGAPKSLAPAIITAARAAARAD